MERREKNVIYGQTICKVERCKITGTDFRLNTGGGKRFALRSNLITNANHIDPLRMSNGFSFIVVIFTSFSRNNTSSSTDNTSPRDNREIQFRFISIGTKRTGLSIHIS